MLSMDSIAFVFFRITKSVLSRAKHQGKHPSPQEEEGSSTKILLNRRIYIHNICCTIVEQSMLDEKFKQIKPDRCLTNVWCCMTNALVPFKTVLNKRVRKQARRKQFRIGPAKIGSSIL